MKWKLIVKRKLTLLFYDLIATGQIKKSMKKFLGIDFGFDHYRSIDGEVSLSLREIDESDKIAKEEYLKQDTRFFKSLLEKWDSFIKELEKISLEISKTDYSNKSNQELIEEFLKLKNAYYKFSTALNAPMRIEKLADEIIKNYLKKYTNKIEDYFNILTTPEKDNQGTLELKSMLKIAIKLKKGQDVSKDIKEHIKEFGWINTRGFVGNEWSKKEIKERLNSMLGEDLQARLEKLENHTKEIKDKTEKILSEIKADDEFREFVKVTKELVNFRTLRMDIYVKYGFLARPLFKEIAKRFNLNMHAIFYLLTDEIIDSLKTKKNLSKLINERKKGFGFIVYKENITVLKGKALEEYKEKYVKEEIKKDITELKGTIASKGIIKGTVKVLTGKHEINKIEKGDILVTSMTTPDFVPAMEKAAAFVTDEGGILCHAAIVSREMNKPCIIGTKIATRVLKDGDEVEINANNEGIIKVIKRNRTF